MGRRTRRASSSPEFQSSFPAQGTPRDDTGMPASLMYDIVLDATGKQACFLIPLFLTFDCTHVRRPSDSRPHAHFFRRRKASISSTTLFSLVPATSSPSGTP